ncbi:astacin (Peptidase family m12A) domain-containing protein [Ditylenchus destructor]|uniref:Metalloendopeptidase n=1 Tax=Ditylenchus destructor TaxID=166010 RepID=A0AAD4R6D5_9BILA|nr:astacin (Peptidase family m12A) domain-containing protein [Ditylenchus destructor]
MRLVVFHLLIFYFIFIGVSIHICSSTLNSSLNDDIRLLPHTALKSSYKSTNDNPKIHFTPGVSESNNFVDSQLERIEEELTKHWPHGIIPFTISDAEPFDSEFYEQFGQAVEDFHENTCVTFRPKLEFDKYFIKIINGNGCWSYVGMQPELMFDGQEVSLGPECWRKGIILHEIMHVLGFFHEHSRHDRDEFIQLNFANIQESWFIFSFCAN